MQLLKNRYKIEKVLGQGGMGKVHLAVDTLEKKYVAIKQISISDTTKDFEQYWKRFKREYYFLSVINHPNVIKAYAR